LASPLRDVYKRQPLNETGAHLPTEVGPDSMYGHGAAHDHGYAASRASQSGSALKSSVPSDSNIASA
ncbi:hypothetical protein, partial [Streptomyces resistomycificus]|uniref:hypothetical protein n=1 Tax=Streptomyces resistomycificus TaxID=67356 RepID=UPI00056477A2